MEGRYQNKNVLVIGLGISGRAAAQFLLHQGAKVRGIDKNAELLQKNDALAVLRTQGLVTSHESQDLDMGQFDLVVISPGIPPTHPFYEAARRARIEIIGEMELACRAVSQKFLGITGTNGKTTVTMLAAHVLNQAGMSAKALGNVGVPIASEIDLLSSQGGNEIIVAELSSFQLDTLSCQVMDAGVILNITPDHLDRYANMEEYARSKIHMKDCLKPDGVLYVEESAYRKYGKYFKSFKPMLYGYTSSCDLFSDGSHLIFHGKNECVLPPEHRGGKSHNIENLMAAYALCREMGVAPEQFMRAFSIFEKPAHRIEFIKTIYGVSFYDDSKGTNIDAVIRAVELLKGQIVLIAGGVDKGAPYTPWIEAFSGKVRGICAIGQAAEKIKQDLSHAMPVEVVDSLECAVRYAAASAKPGENVLLSPGCASFDMFRDYAHRGDEFKKIVNALTLQDIDTKSLLPI